MSNICIIPARGGSKRIPKKNIKDFLGKPIIAYSIITAVNSRLFDEVMVSTDDSEIASIAEKYGANVPFIRSSSNSRDFSTIADVVDEVNDFYVKSGQSFNYGCCLLPTACLTTINQIEKALRLLIKLDVDSVRPVVKYSYPVQRAFKFLNNGEINWVNPEFAYSRTQDLEEYYHDAGQFYWFKTKKGLRSSNRSAIVINQMTVQDIDTPDDWELAKLKYNLLK